MSAELVESPTDVRRHALMADLAEQGAQLAIKKLGVDEDLEDLAIESGNAPAEIFPTTGTARTST